VSVWDVDYPAHGKDRGISNGQGGVEMNAMFGIALMAAGVVGVGFAARRSHQAGRHLDFIRGLGQESTYSSDVIEVSERISSPLGSRLLGPAAQRIRHSLARLYPARDLDRVHADLLKAGLTGSIRAEEFAAIQVGGILLGCACGLAVLVAGVVSVKVGVALLFLLLVLGGLGPSFWLRSRISERRDAVTNDLPDVLDLMTISVAAGLGLEQAMMVSCANFDSPVCDELQLTLREMELGLSRHDALANLKIRTEIDDLVTFAVVLSQADALGLPIGRVLQSHADEMRDKRRQRARERAAKVPVKILFPLAFCFMPAIMILVLGPLVGPIKHALAGA
jgi:tight adherence protein C